MDGCVCVGGCVRAFLGFVASSPLSKPGVALRDGTTVPEHFLNCNRMFETLQRVRLNDAVLSRGRRFAAREGELSKRHACWVAGDSAPPPTLTHAPTYWWPIHHLTDWLTAHADVHACVDIHNDRLHFHQPGQL